MAHLRELVARERDDLRRTCREAAALCGIVDADAVQPAWAAAAHESRVAADGPLRPSGEHLARLEAGLVGAAAA